MKNATKFVLSALKLFPLGKTKALSFWQKVTIILLMIVVFMHKDSCGWKRKMLLVEPKGTSLKYCYIKVKITSHHILYFRFLPYVGMVTIIMNDYPQVKVLIKWSSTLHLNYLWSLTVFYFIFFHSILF